MSILTYKALHIITMTTWFSGLFYLPRLFVYHAMSNDTISQERFKIMEKKLYYFITWPSAILTTFFGLLLLHHMPFLMKSFWLHAKLSLVAALWLYHLSCGYFLKRFKNNQIKLSHIAFRWFNEIPVVFLIAIVFLVVLQPSY